MNLWLDVIGSIVCAGFGISAGLWFSRMRRWYWTLGYFVPLVLILAYAVAYHFPAIMFLPLFSWAMGIKKFAVFGLISAMVLTTPLCKLPQKRARVLICFLMAVIVFMASVWPFLAPMIDRRQLRGLQTHMDKNGVCLQTTDFTCGPASAVTALRKLGLPADEGEIAILSCTSEMEGTPEDMLADGLKREYSSSGLLVQCRVFRSVAELKQAGLTLAVVKYGFMVDHWVAVLGVTDSEVIVGDPLGGLDHLSYADFAGKWRFVGIVLGRKPSV